MSRVSRAMGKVKNKTNAPAIIGIVPDDDNVMVLGGRQLKAGDEDLFPENVKTTVFVSQSGYGHSPCVGFELTAEHGELYGPCSTATHYEVQGVIKAADSYKLSFVRPLKGAGVVAFNLADSTADEKLQTLPSEVVPQPIIDANNKGADLVALWIEWDDKPVDEPEGEPKLGLVTYPPAVAKGTNYGLVHNDEPFDDGVTISKILASPCIFAYIPRSHYPHMMHAVNQGMAASPIDLDRPYGIKAMPDYNRSHLEEISDHCWLGPNEAPIIPQRITDYPHIHNAMFVGMGLDTLPMQQDIEKLATKTCRAVLFRGENERLFAGFELPWGDEFRQLLNAVNRDGQEVHILTKGPIPRDHKSNDKKSNFEERVTFFAKILVALPAGVNLPLSCDIFAEVYPGLVGAEEIGSAEELSDLLDLRLQFKDETSQTKRHIANFSKNLDEIELQPDEHEDSGSEEHYIREMQKRSTRDMLCGRGARHYTFGSDHRIVELLPPYPFNEVDLVELTGTEAKGHLFATILSNTIGKLGSYSELIKSFIRALPDGILSIEAFPGAGKTTVTAAIDAFLCLLSEKIKIVVIAAQNAALDALTDNLSSRLREAVTNINKELSLDSSARPKQLPLVLRVFISDHREIIELVRIVKSSYRCGPDPERPNTLCELLLQLLGAGPHSLPAFSKSGLIELAAKVKSEDSRGFQKLRHFVAGDMTWEDANLTTWQDTPIKTPQSALTAKHALDEIVESILPLVNVLVCTTAAATLETCKKFVEQADLCQNEEAGATSSSQIFSGWRGIGQPLIVSGDSAQFGPYIRNYRKHIFREFLATSTLDMIKTAGYPTFLLNTQHRAIDGQFDPVYEIFYSDFKSTKSPTTQHPDNYPNAQRVEASFVADFSGLQPSPAGRIVPIFIHVPESTCKYIGKSRHSPQQTKAAKYVVKKLITCDIKPANIVVIGAYRAEVTELRKEIPQNVLVTTADALQGQERPYVVFVFATNKETGPGFTMDRHRLCVSMSRQKEFLALVGDIETVDKNFTPSGNDDTAYLARVHKYFITNQRVGIYEETKEALRDAAEPAPEPFTVDVGDEREVRLFSQVHAAIIALKDYQASKSKKPVVKSSTDSALGQKPDTPSPEAKATTKPTTLRKRLTAWAREAQQPVLKAAVNSNGSWNDSGDAQIPGEKTSSSPSHKSGTSGENNMKGHGSWASGHLNKDRPKREQVTCYNCHEAGHKINDCKKPQKPIDYSKVQCRRCKNFGHTPTKCDQPPSRGINSDFGTANTLGANDSTSNYTGW